MCVCKCVYKCFCGVGWVGLSKTVKNSSLLIHSVPVYVQGNQMFYSLWQIHLPPSHSDRYLPVLNLSQSQPFIYYRAGLIQKLYRGAQRH